jgi:hypothetical protein
MMVLTLRATLAPADPAVTRLQIYDVGRHVA